MLNLKKVIASICVIAMVLTTVAFGATYSDVAEDSVYYEAVETLTKMGIVNGDNGEYRPEDGVTRAEMAKLIACIQGYGDTAMGAANTAFTDVPSSHWASGYIANAAGMGIINGYGDGTFGPEDPVLYEQAIKMVMATLGYTPFAEKNGGYPTGYLAAAQRYDVSLAVSNAAVGQEANRGTVAQILVNAIDTPLMVQKEWNTNGEVVYEIAEGKWDNTLGRTVGYKTLMSENLGYIKLRGEVNATTIARLNSAKDFDTTEDPFIVMAITDDYGTENKVFLNNVNYGNQEFLVGDTDAEDFLGHAVVAYAKVNAKDEFELVSIAVDSNRNDVMTISIDQFVDYDQSTDEITYYKEGASQTSTVEVSGSLAAVYNGTGMDAATALDETAAVDPKYGGEIKLIGRDDDRYYDVAIVTVATTGVVKKVTEDAVTFQRSLAWACAAGGNQIDFDAEATDKVFEIKKDGNVIAPSELAEWDVLSLYAKDESSDIIKAEVIGTQVIGTITSTKNSQTSATSKAYSIDGNWYDAAKGVYGSGDLDISEGGTFYIDQFGKIAAFVEDAALAGGAAGNYGYVLAVKAEESKFGSAGSMEVNVQMLTADGVEVFQIKNNSKLNVADDFNTPADADSYGDTAILDINNWTASSFAPVTITSGSDDVAMYNALTATAGTVVKYTVSNGYIGSITVDGHDDDDIELKGTTAAIDVEYDEGLSKFSGTGANFKVEDDTVVFIVDADPAKCAVGTLADLDDENEYGVSAWYANKKTNRVNMIVVQEATINTNTKDGIAVVKEIGIGNDEESGETIWTITYLKGGEVATATTTPDAAFAYGTAPTAGDIIKVKVGSDNTITKLTKLYDFPEAVRKFTGAGNNAIASLTGTYTGEEKYYGGYVVACDEDVTEIAIDTDGDFAADYNADISGSDVNVYTVDATGRELVVKNGGAFKYFEKVYAGGTVTIIDENNKLGYAYDSVNKVYSATGVAQNDAIKLTDHVYVRVYDGEVTDMVVVKGANIKVR